jgi:glycosyltransferase involved in cell wall biosynthesis
MPALPAFSVCIPCLNAGPYLRDRFDSLLAQNHRDFEIVVLDSESTDGSWEIILDHAARDPRIRAHREPRRGLYEDWNACVARARHDWIYVATADDTLAPDALAVFGAAIRDHPEARLVGSRLWQIDADGRDYVDPARTQCRDLLGCRHRAEGWCSPWTEFLHAVLVSAPFNSVTQIVFHRHAFDRAGGFSTRYGACGNGALQLRLLLAEPAYYLPRRLGSWRRHPAQISVTRPVSIHGNLRATLAHLAKDARVEGLIPASLPFDLVVGLACGTTQREIPPGLPPRPARLARRFQALGLFHRRRPRLAAFVLLGVLSRIFPHPRPFAALRRLVA